MTPGSVLLRDFVGSSVGDPNGRSRGAAVGGFAGLAIGTAGYFLTRRRVHSEASKTDNENE